MLQSFQDYLFQFKQAAIPGVGAFRVKESPAVLDVANQQLLPPAVVVTHERQVTLTAHQLQTLAVLSDHDTERADAALNELGVSLRNSVEHQPFDWGGIGQLSLDTGGRLVFTPQPENLLTPVTAQRVLREKVQHTVLVGDQELQYVVDTNETGTADAAPVRSWLLLIGWLLALCAAIFIAYQLYSGQWQVGATGLQSRPAIGVTPEQYR